MAAWFIPAVKAILPLVSPIVSAALPVFTTRKNDEAATNQSEILQRQITELQTAASRNALHVKELAEQLQKTVAALEQGATVAEARFKRTSMLSGIAIASSLVAIVLSLFALLLR
jgi:hypothetical protein